MQQHVGCVVARRDRSPQLVFHPEGGIRQRPVVPFRRDRAIPFDDLEMGREAQRESVVLLSFVSHVVSADPELSLPGYVLERDFGGVRVLRRDAAAPVRQCASGADHAPDRRRRLRAAGQRRHPLRGSAVSRGSPAPTNCDRLQSRAIAQRNPTLPRSERPRGRRELASARGTRHMTASFAAIGRLIQTRRKEVQRRWTWAYRTSLPQSGTGRRELEGHDPAPADRLRRTGWTPRCASTRRCSTRGPKNCILLKRYGAPSATVPTDSW